MKKKYIIIIACIIFIIFLIFYYKNFLNGNNILKKTSEQIIENILDENLSYTADIQATVYSNKNQNEYEIIQEENNEKSSQEVVSKGDIEGLYLEYKSNTFILKNTKLNLEKIFENYNEISNNYLFLKTFVKEYLESENVEISEDETTIIVKIELKNFNKYIKYKELYIDKDTEMPKELIIKNSDKQETVCIKYISIEIFQ